MSMYTLLRNHPQPRMEEIEDAFQGKIARHGRPQLPSLLAQLLFIMEESKKYI